MPVVFRGLTWAEVAVVVVAALMALGVGFRIMVPPSIWFRVGDLDVHSATRWQDVRVQYDRTIRREFYGAWRVEVSRQVAGGWEEVGAGPKHHQTYTPDTVLPDGGMVTLDWFTGPPPACYALTDPGRYQLCAYWTVNEGAWLGLLTRRIDRCGTFEIVGA